MSDYPLPEWADPRLVVDVGGAGDGHAVIDGNGQTFRGLIRLVDISDGLSFSAKAGDISPRNDYAEGWISGYITGNEPELEFPGDLPDSRHRRELEFFRGNSRVLPIERRGVLAFSAKSVIPARDQAGRGFSDAVGRIESAISHLAETSSWWSSSLWRPLARDGAPLEPLTFVDSKDIESAFRWLNPPYAIESTDSLGAIVRLLSTDPGGAVELVVTIDYPAAAEDTVLSVLINIENTMPFGLESSESGQLCTEDWMRRSLMSLVVGVGADVASVSFGLPLLECRGFRVVAGEDESTLSMVPGWITILGDSVLREEIGNANIDGFERASFAGGVAFEFTGGSVNLTPQDVNRVADLIGVV